MKSPEERAATLYNAGNSLYQANKYQEAINAYKQSLRLNPNDEDTRYNLQMARAKLAQQQQQQKQQNKDQKQDQKKDQQKQDQQQNQQQNQKQNQQQKQEEAKQDQTRQQLQKKNQMPKQEADRILDAMRNNEKEPQKNLRKREAVHVKVEKDW